ncbi:MAG: endolytic transglycosylase MltG, partial [Bacteroidia bacterium]|nr:endolytic transglycosylase MltG [Bacteroidia bacterium]MDW8333078.1 endolytic transglycosylase MltG [Bacteroidia bacterium]
MQYILAATIALAASAIAVAAYVLFYPNVRPQEKDLYLYLRPGDGFDKILSELRENDALHNVATFVWTARLFGLDQNVKAGRYRVKPGMSNFRLARNLSKGYQTPVRITLPSEPTVERIVARLTA